MGSNGSVLIVDDDESILGMLRETLSSGGYACETAASGEAAVELLEAKSFDIMLTDIVMPGIGGFEVTERARKRHPDLLVIIMTGFVDDFSYDRAIASGASDFIKKPFTAAEVTARIKHVKLQERLRIMAITDELSGLLNRRGFFSLAEQQLKLAKRNRTNVFLIYIDMDKLKEINDRLGHHEGDRALTDIANLLRATFRESDIIARIGGDEFVVIPVESRESSVETITARLRRNLDRHNVSETRSYKLSASIGMACYQPGGTDSIDELLAEADQSMFEEKRLKRDT